MSYKKKILIGVGILVVLVAAIGISYALWTFNVAQNDVNSLTSDCFKIEFTDKNAISLNSAYPIEDEMGMMLTPYTFTIKNVCNGSAKYQINLETMMPSGKKLPDKYLKANLSEGETSKITTKLDKTINSNLDTSTTINGAVEAYKLVSGTLKPNETKEFNLRLWIHSDVTQTDGDSMNASFQGKISIIASYYEDNSGIMMARSDDYAFWQTEYIKYISKVVIEPTIDAKDTDLVWDISQDQDGSVMSYLVTTGEKVNEYNYKLGKEEMKDKYILYIQGDGEVISPSNCSYIFAFEERWKFEGADANLDNALEEINGLEYFNTSNVTNMSAMFIGDNKLISLDLSSFDTSKVTNMSRMFSGYNVMNSLTNLDVSNFNTGNVTDMSYMFGNCHSLTSLDLSNFDTSNVTDMSSMFLNCASLTSLDLSNFDTSNVTNMSRMFFLCSSLTNLDISSFDTSNVTNTLDMFYGMSSEAIIYVKDETAQSWVLTSGNNSPSSWTTNNVIIKG